MMRLAAYRVQINGIVQGVGFRPFIYRLANKYELKGWVKNTSAGVEIQVSGPPERLQSFISSIKKDAPSLAKIDSLAYESIAPEEWASFEILHSQVVAGAFQPISPDVCTCQDCLEELFTPTYFRYRYPFINCTNCGPRFTIIKDIPYDRPQTTMGSFDLCDTCRSEYEDPLNRRFHAQPVACPNCGPEVWMEKAGGSDGAILERGDAAIRKAQELLAEGGILAIKGLGGFHLACDGENQAAVRRLRERKTRPDKPLAVMMPDLATVSHFCLVTKEEERELSSPQRPILLLSKQDPDSLPVELAPGQQHVGVMLPYTPLHYLLFSREDSFPDAPYKVLVMTSANFSGTPILTNNQEVREKLKDIADYYLFHNREIFIHCDDSVARMFSPSGKGGELYPIRRSRGYSPQPVKSPLAGNSVLGVGAELKNAFCLSKDNYTFISQHIGDLRNFQTLTSFEKSISHFEAIFRVSPELIVYDLHPDYLSTRYAQERSTKEGIPLLGVQHHHAHIASCLADNVYLEDQPVIGLAFDGTGYGDDGAIWGGEILIADYHGYTRFGHLKYFPLPGGDAAIRDPWRTALSLLDSAGIPWEESCPSVQFSSTLPEVLPGVKPLEVLENQLAAGTNAPLTSSLGRLFDAVASLTGLCHRISYEGQAAIELEALADTEESGQYHFEFAPDQVLDPGIMVSQIVEDLRQGAPASVISARFHNTMAGMVLQAALLVRERYQLNTAALSGGVWQNMTLLRKSVEQLQAAGFKVLLHHQVPPNDGGISLGQVVIGQGYLQV
jgi:hydrogenase maturation protein HypF